MILDPYHKQGFIYPIYILHNNPYETWLFYTQMEAEIQWLLLRSPVSIARMWTHDSASRPVFSAT